jgi:hypothetical protein
MRRWGHAALGAFVCDGRPDCAGDERNCPDFICDDGATVPANCECDGNDDCPTGEDEHCVFECECDNGEVVRNAVCVVDGIGVWPLELRRRGRFSRHGTGAAHWKATWRSSTASTPRPRVCRQRIASVSASLSRRALVRGLSFRPTPSKQRAPQATDRTLARRRVDTRPGVRVPRRRPECHVRQPHLRARPLSHDFETREVEVAREYSWGASSSAGPCLQQTKSGPFLSRSRLSASQGRPARRDPNRRSLATPLPEPAAVSLCSAGKPATHTSCFRTSPDSSIITTDALTLLLWLPARMNAVVARPQ